ncbi:MAG: RdgB/HAM1 family non-canonical purine NTP pyrophosphatase [Ardenticatenia bacterium]|nr:RdgB/HAM1 family non-canonical purine NTP pyrophosphatase [Ardenticatenia bacterium]
MVQIVIATGNPGKRQEYKALLGQLPVTLVMPDDLGLSLHVDEHGATFDENAVLKALAYARAADMPALADDSGLEVDVLGGFPGIHSARWAGPTDEDRVRALLAKMEAVPWARRQARFVCAVALVTPLGHVVTALGTVDGRILFAPRGNGGFGYDPIFYVAEVARTMAELSPEEKNRLSHRGRAARAIRPHIESLLGFTPPPAPPS